MCEAVVDIALGVCTRVATEAQGGTLQSVSSAFVIDTFLPLMPRGQGAVVSSTSRLTALSAG